MKKVALITVTFCLFAMAAWSQSQEIAKIPLIGEKAISFTAESTNGQITFPEDYGSKWKILFSHPKDFTPVCSSEILEMANLQAEFKKLNTALVVVSVDNLEDHKSWKESLENTNYRDRGTQKIDFPLVDDQSKQISKAYGMLQTTTNSSKDVRGVFIIDPNNVIQAMFFYPMTVGRNFDEIKRTLIALQTTKDALVIPANWQPGNDVMLSYLSPEEQKMIGKPNSNLYQLSWYMTFMKVR